MAKDPTGAPVPTPPFQAVPAWDPPPAVWGQAQTPHSNAGSRNPNAFLVGPGTGHPGW